MRAYRRQAAAYLAWLAERAGDHPDAFRSRCRRARERIAAWLLERGNHPGPLWLGQRGPLSVSGVTQVVPAVGRQAGVPGLRPHRLRHSYATRLRQGGADPAQIQALLGHASAETAGRYFRAGASERTAVVERVFE